MFFGTDAGEPSEEVGADVAECAESPADLVDAGGVDRHVKHFLVLGTFGEDGSPGIDDETVSVEADACDGASGLVGGEDKDLVFDGARAKQHLPVGFAGKRGEGGRDGDDSGAEEGEESEELGEAEVVTDGESDGAHGRAGDDGAGSGEGVTDLIEDDAVRLRDGEEVHLAVGREDVAFGGDEETGVAALAPIGAAFEDGPGEDVDSMFFGERGEAGTGGTWDVLGGVAPERSVGDETEDLREQDEAGAGGDGVFHHSTGVLDVLLLVGARLELNQRDVELHGHLRTGDYSECRRDVKRVGFV